MKSKIMWELWLPLTALTMFVVSLYVFYPPTRYDPKTACLNHGGIYLYGGSGLFSSGTANCVFPPVENPVAKDSK